MTIWDLLSEISPSYLSDVNIIQIKIVSKLLSLCSAAAATLKGYEHHTGVPVRMGTVADMGWTKPHIFLVIPIRILARQHTKMSKKEANKVINSNERRLMF